MYHTLAYANVFSGAATLQDATALADSEFSQRNGHYIFTEKYRLLGAISLGATIAQARFNVPTINAVGFHNVWPLTVGATIPSNPWWQDLRSLPFPLPQDEEVAIQQTATAAETEFTILQLGTMDWNQNLPSGQQRLTLRATSSLANVAAVWAGLSALTFESTLRGGWYAVVGMQIFQANCIAARLVFPRQTLYGGRKLRPGVLGTNAVANQPARWQDGGLGVMGVFHSFEPPQLEVLGTATAAANQVVFLDVAYLGNSGGYANAPAMA